MAVREGDWVRYADDFVRETSTTEAGAKDMASRRGMVLTVFGDGRLCNVDWGDVVVQFDTASPSLVAADAPDPVAEAGEPEPEAEGGFRPR